MADTCFFFPVDPSAFRPLRFLIPSSIRPFPGGRPRSDPTPHPPTRSNTDGIRSDDTLVRDAITTRVGMNKCNSVRGIRTGGGARALSFTRPRRQTNSAGPSRRRRVYSRRKYIVRRYTYIINVYTLYVFILRRRGTKRPRGTPSDYK